MIPAERGPSGTGHDTAVVHPATRDLWAWLQCDAARALSAEKRTLIAERIMDVDADLLAWDAAADPPVAVPGPASERDLDDAYEDLERADHIDALCGEMVELGQVPPDVLAPIQSYAVWLRNRARESDRGR